MNFLFDAAVFFERVRSKEVRYALSLIERSENASRNQILEMQNQAFLNLVSQAYSFSPYYKNTLDKNGLTPKSFYSIEDIGKFTILTKDIIKSKRDSLKAKNQQATKYITRTSGGTTGEPIKMDVNSQSALIDLYFYYRGLKWMGYNPGSSMIKFFGGSLGGNNSPTLRNKIKKFVSGELFLPAFSLTRENCNEYFDQIQKRGKTFLQGYVSTLYTLAIYAKETNRAKKLNILGVFTTAEQLPSEQAAFISEVFSCEVKSFYGCAEINCLGFQTKMGGPYIIPEEIVHIENCGKQHSIHENSFLTTSLYNYTTPLIRYLNGDNGRLITGEKYLLIDELYGRTADMFKHPNGSYISSIVATQTMQITGLTHKIKRYQLVQKDIDSIELRYSLFENQYLEKNELDKIVAMYKKRLGEEFKLAPIQTETFIKSSSGKHRLMINQIT